MQGLIIQLCNNTLVEGQTYFCNRTDNWVFLEKEMKLNSWLLPCKKTNSRYIKDSKVKRQNYRTFRRKFGRTIFWPQGSKVFFINKTQRTLNHLIKEVLYTLLHCHILMQGKDKSQTGGISWQKRGISQEKKHKRHKWKMIHWSNTQLKKTSKGSE